MPSEDFTPRQLRCVDQTQWRDELIRPNRELDWHSTWHGLFLPRRTPMCVSCYVGASGPARLRHCLVGPTPSGG
jgi:hypothetical protein